MQRLLLLLALLCTGGCGTLDQLYWQGRDVAGRSGLLAVAANERANSWQLAPETRLYVAIPRSEETHAQQIYQQLSAQLLTTASRHFPYSEHGRLPESVDYALQMARRRGADVLLFPQPLQWQDGLSNWREIGTYLRTPAAQRAGSGFVRDSVRMGIQLIQVDSGRVLDSAYLHAQSGLLTLHGDRPGSILAAAIEDYFAKLTLHNAGRL